MQKTAAEMVRRSLMTINILPSSGMTSPTVVAAIHLYTTSLLAAVYRSAALSSLMHTLFKFSKREI